MDERDLGSGDLTGVTELTGGTQNILVLFERAGERYVLRRPPVHKRANSDKTMQRESRVLEALAGSGVPHPGFIAGEPDIDVLGASFYLMEPIDGFNANEGLPEPHNSSAELRRQMGFAFIDAIAALADVDYLEVGLEGFGRPDGYLERQVPRWRSYLESYHEISSDWRPDIPGLERVADWLEANRPTEQVTGIIHGDYHPANVMYRHDGPELAAVVDWELSTIGDPRIDLGLVMAFNTPDGLDDGQAGPRIAGFPPTAELIDRYAERSGLDCSQANWFGVLACYKTGIILESTNARAIAGTVPQETGDQFHEMVIGLFRTADKLIHDAEGA